MEKTGGLSEQDKKYIRANYKKMTAIQMANHLGKWRITVYNFLHNEGLEAYQSIRRWEMKGRYFNCDGFCPITGIPLTSKKIA